MTKRKAGKPTVLGVRARADLITSRVLHDLRPGYSTGPHCDPGLHIDLLGLIRFFADFSNFRRDFITIDVPHSVRPFACDLGRSFCHQ